jgi:hypothetical protein
MFELDGRNNMAWLAVDRDGSEQIYGYLPEKDGDDV